MLPNLHQIPGKPYFHEYQIILHVLEILIWYQLPSFFSGESKKLLKSAVEQFFHLETML